MMAELLRKYFCMFPNTAYMLIEGWRDKDTDVVIVTDQGTPTAGAEHAVKLPQGTLGTNSISTFDLEENDVLRSTITVKFSQRDTYLNQNPLHYFCRFNDNAGVNQAAALYYEGIGVNDNRIGIEDANGVRAVLDTGPFFANQWMRLDSIWRHADSTGWWLWKNGIFQGNATGRDFFTTAGGIQIVPEGQRIVGSPGPGGDMYVSFLAHWTDAAVAASTPYAKYLFRPYNHYGTVPICDHNGNPGGPTLFSGTSADLWDNAITRCGYRGVNMNDALGGCWSSDRDIDRSGPHSRFAEGTVAVAATGCLWTDMTTKGGNDADPHLLFGRGNGNLDTFNIFEMGINRGVNVKSQKLLLPGDVEFPGINDYAMSGFLNRQTVAPAPLYCEEAIVSYLVEHPAPPLTQVKVLGDTQGLGDAVVAA